MCFDKAAAGVQHQLLSTLISLLCCRRFNNVIIVYYVSWTLLISLPPLSFL